MSYIYPAEIHTIESPFKRDGKCYVNILLLRYPDLSSRCFQLVSGGYYSHASIGVSDMSGTFYSYVTAGFRKEFPGQHPTFKQQEVPCRLYRIEVSEKIYAATLELLDEHAKQAHKFGYSSLGVVLCLLRIAYRRKNRYFCSQFVSEILERIEAVPLAKHSALYLPDDFTKMKGLDLFFTGNLSELVRLAVPKTFSIA